MQPERKELRLPNYDYSQNGAYFITICTQDRRKLLNEIVGDDVGIVPYEQNCKHCTFFENVNLKRIGESIFQRSYYGHVIRNQQDYNEIWDYIAYNPLKWAIEKRGRE